MEDKNIKQDNSGQVPVGMSGLINNERWTLCLTLLGIELSKDWI